MLTQFERKSCCTELYSAGLTLISTELVNHVHFNVSIRFFQVNWMTFMIYSLKYTPASLLKSIIYFGKLLFKLNYT